MSDMMFPRKIYFLFLLFLLIFQIGYGQIGQNPPNACVNPPAGYIVGQEFGVNKATCLGNSGDATILVSNTNNLTSLAFIFDYLDTDGTNFLTNPKLKIVNSGNSSSIPVTATEAGRDYWIMAIGNNSAGSKTIKCEKTVIYKTSATPVMSTPVACGNTVTVTIPTDPANQYDTYVINWGDGNVDNITKARPFSQPHTYTAGTASPIVINVGGGYANPDPTTASAVPYVCTSFSTTNKTVTLSSASSTPYINRLEMTDGGKGMKLNYLNGTTGSTYRVVAAQGNTGNFNLTLGNATNSSFTYPSSPGLDATIAYCFRIEGQDGCGSIVPSEPVCSIKVDAQAVTSTQVELDWNRPTPYLTTYEVTRTEQGNTTPKTDFPTPMTNNTYTDNSVTCLKNYNYFVEGVYSTPLGVVRTISATVPISTKSAVSNLLPLRPPLSVSVIPKNQYIEINFEGFPSGTHTYKIERSEDGGSYKEISQQTTSGLYQDKNVEPKNHRYCYRISYTDDCGNWSLPSVPMCNVLLTQNTSQELAWTPLFDDPVYNSYVKYSVFAAKSATGTLKDDPITLYSSNADSPFAVTIDETKDNTYVVYAIYVIPGVLPNIMPSISNTYTFEIPAKFLIPTAFTPNGDIDNDELLVKINNFVEEFTMLVFNQWGNPVKKHIYAKNAVIFTKFTGITIWDGNLEDGSPAPIGNYAYVINYKDVYGNESSKRGVISLLK